MTERHPADIEKKAGLARDRVLKVRTDRELKERRMLENASSNLAYISQTLSQKPNLIKYLEDARRSIDITTRTYLSEPGRFVDTSRVQVNSLGVVVVKHRLHAWDISGQVGSMGEVDALASSELFSKLWYAKEARSLIKAFARMSHPQIDRKLFKGIK